MTIIKAGVTLSAAAALALASSACQQATTNVAADNIVLAPTNAASSVAAPEPANATAKPEPSNAAASAPRMSQAEREAYMQRHGVGFAAVDADADGRVTLAESRAYARRTLGGGDSDGDGTISAAEMARVDPRMRTALSRADANGDGAIAAAEFEAHLARRFAALDANRDGGVTEAEMRAGSPSS